MKIGIDIDNTITYTTEMIMHYASIFGNERGLNTVPDNNYYYLEDALGWDKETADHFLTQNLQYIYKDMQPKERAPEVIRELKKDHEIILITSRNRKFHDVEQITADWLHRNSIVYDKLILNATDNMHFFSKLKVCMDNSVDVMIEDHHELIKEICPVLPVIVFDYPYNSHLTNQNIIRVNNWAEIKTWINDFAAHRARQWGQSQSLR